ncbi:MAG: hypothetical protein U0235_13290 [Polyangiaceae bacterium]
MLARSALTFVILSGAIAACDPRRTSTPLPETPATSTPSASAPTATTSTTKSRFPEGSRVAEVLRACAMPAPPDTCTTDADCSTLDLPSGRCGGCAETTVLGVSAAAKAAFVGSHPCRRAPCDKPSPSCVVHWHRDEDGQTGAPSDIRAVCIKGVCVSRATKPH